MRRGILLLVVLLVVGSYSCSEEQPTTIEKRTVFSTAGEQITAEDAGRLHNAILREVDKEYEFARRDTINYDNLAQILADAINTVSDNENIDTTVSQEDVLDVFAEIYALRANDVYDFTGSEGSNPLYFIAHQYNQQLITGEEYEELVEMYGDELWALGVGDFTTDKAKQAVAIRDSSRAFWISQGLVSSTDDFNAEIDWYSIGIIASDAGGGLLATALSGGNPYAGILGGALISTAFVAGVTCAEEEPCPGGSCVGYGEPWFEP
jgi:hypothetical protein